MPDSNLLNVEYRKVETLIPYARNPRTHSDEQVAKIAASIIEFGWTSPVLVDGASGIIAGHGRLAAAQRLGLAEVPVIELAHLSPAQKRAYIIADNRLALDAGWNDELLALELAELTEAGYDLALTGFDATEIEALLADDADRGGDPENDGDGPDAADDVPEAPAVPVTRPGDVWLLGGHRLICGDASDAAVVAALMDGTQSRLCFTSPPYGNQRDYTSGGIADWDGLMRGVFARLPMAEDGQVLVNLGLIHRDNEFIPYWDVWLDWMRTQGWRRFAWYVWDQGPGMPGDWAGRFAPSFEFVFHFNHESRKPNKIVPCKHAGQESHLRADGSSTAMRGKDGKVGGWTHKGQPTQDTRIPDSVIRVMRHKGKIGQPGAAARHARHQLHGAGPLVRVVGWRQRLAQGAGCQLRRGHLQQEHRSLRGDAGCAARRGIVRDPDVECANARNTAADRRLEGVAGHAACPARRQERAAGHAHHHLAARERHRHTHGIRHHLQHTQ